MDREKDMNDTNRKGQNDDLARMETRVSALAFAERKSEKLAAAVYLVTDIVTERDPLRWKLREESINILSDIGHARATPESERAAFLRSSEKGIERVGSLLDIARTAKMISEMNATIVRREYIALREMIEAERVASERSYPVRTVALTERFFSIDTARLPKESIPHSEPIAIEEPRTMSSSIDREAIAPRVNAPARSTEVPEKEESTDRRMSDTSRTMSESNRHTIGGEGRPRSAVVNSTPRVTPEGVRPTPKFAPSPARMDSKPNISSSAHPIAAAAEKKLESGAAPHREHDVAHDRAGKDDRRKIILTLLRHSRDLTVKDIQKGIPGVSEKTVQRELLAMVADGTLQKKGERRWSRYSLKPGASI